MKHARKVTVNGVEYISLKAAAVALGVPYDVVYGRHVRRGWTIDRTFSEPLRNTGPERVESKESDEERRAKDAARVKAYRDQNPEKVKAARSSLYKENAEKIKESRLLWRIQNPTKYAASIIRKGSGLRVTDVPDSLARLKAEQLEIKRLNKQIKQQLKELENETNGNDASNG